MTEGREKAMELYAATMESIDALPKEDQMWVLLTWTKHVLGNMSLLDEQWVHMGKFAHNCQKFSKAVLLLAPAVASEWANEKHDERH